MYAELAEARKALCEPGQLFEIEEIEVDGINLKTWKHAPATLRELWLQSAPHGDSEYLVFGDDRWTYARAHEEVSRCARWMVDHGISPGDRVAIAMRNYPEWMLAYWAVVSVGAVAVGINAWWVSEELAYGLNDSAPKLYICDSERLERYQSVREETPQMGVVVVRPDGELPDYAIDWSQLMEADADMPDVSIEPNDDACIFYTSGTTGRPKGAQLTHRGCTNNVLSTIFSNLSQAQALSTVAGTTFEPPAAPTILLTTPLFHVTANNVLAHTNTMMGAKLVLMYKWDAGEALRLVEREKITMVSGVPVMSREMLAHPDYETTDTSSLTALGGGGAPVQPDLVESISKKSKALPAQGFGMTETSGLATGALGPFLIDKPESVGPVIPIFDVKCVDEDGKALPIGERGEVLLRGAQLIKGYLNKPEATAETIVDGWLHTGDIGYLDDDGFLYIVDRAKDMVLRGGENVYCAEVEAVLFRHPAVAEAAVFSVPDKVLGEEVGAAVRLKSDEPLSAEALRSFAREHLAAYKVPRYLWLLDSPLPQNANGKYLKKDLQKTLDPQHAV
ncbi:MAG: class I adenylate-forming enzyme family protein [Pseudomonadota bacterium]